MSKLSSASALGIGNLGSSRSTWAIIILNQVKPKDQYKVCVRLEFKSTSDIISFLFAYFHSFLLNYIFLTAINSIKLHLIPVLEIRLFYFIDKLTQYIIINIVYQQWNQKHKKSMCLRTS